MITVNTVVAQGGKQIREVINIVDTLKALIPSNPVEAMVNLNIVGLVIFSSIVGVAAKRMSKKYMDIVKPFFDLNKMLYKKIIVSNGYEYHQMDASCSCSSTC